MPNTHVTVIANSQLDNITFGRHWQILFKASWLTRPSQRSAETQSGPFTGQHNGHFVNCANWIDQLSSLNVNAMSNNLLLTNRLQIETTLIGRCVQSVSSLSKAFIWENVLIRRWEYVPITWRVVLNPIMSDLAHHLRSDVGGVAQLAICLLFVK